MPDPGAVSRRSRPSYGGVFFDNVRYRVAGKPCRTRRDEVMRPEHLGVADSVSYLEVGHWVGGLAMDGVVVLYSNPEDGGRVRVEWRPPRGFVKGNGVASARRASARYLEVAFKAIAVVLREELPPRRLSRLFDWLFKLWAPALR